MPQNTEVEAPKNPPDQSVAPSNTSAATGTTLPSETHSASEPPPSRGSRFKSNPRTRFYVIGIVLVLIVGGIFAWRYFESYESTDDAEVDGHLQPLSARVSGYVTKVNVDDNQYVTAGTVLVEIDPRDYQVAVDQAKAALEDARGTAQASNLNVPITNVNTASQISSSEADIQNAQAGIAAAQQQYDAAQAQLAEAQANDVKAQLDVGRYKQLVDKQEISQQQYDQAVAAAKANSAAVAGARANADAAQSQVTQAQQKLVQAEASWRNAQTGPRQMEIQRSRAASALADA